MSYTSLTSDSDLIFRCKCEAISPMVDETGTQTVTAQGGAGITVGAGKFNNGIHVAGVNDYINLASHASLDFTSDFSLFLWHKNATASSGYEYLAESWAAGTNNRRWGLFWTNLEQMLFSVSGDGVGVSSVAGPTVTDTTTWHSCCIRYEAGVEITMRHDGVGFSNTTSIPASLHSNQQASRFGTKNDNSLDYTGAYDDIWLITRLFTDDEVAELEAGPEPLNTVVPVVTGTLTVGSTLSSTTGTWDSLGNGSLSYSYQWQAAGRDLPGATSATYVVTGAGDYRCGVTATNAGGASESVAYSLASVVPTDDYEGSASSRGASRNTVRLGVH